MSTTRREVLARAVGGAAVAAGALPSAIAAESSAAATASSAGDGYKYRVAFGCWTNDMRNTPLPLTKWPAPQLDDEAVSGALAAVDVAAEAGFNYLDSWGLFATYGYPPDVQSAFADSPRLRQAERLIRAAKDKGLRYLFGLGLFSWGYDEIVKADPQVQGHSRDGRPLAHVMCGAKEKAWTYIEKILDTALGRFDFAGVHLESADLGWCDCPQCGGKDGSVAYNVRLNRRAADYIRRKWPGKIITCIPINWLGGARPCFNEAEKAHILELSGHVDCFMDQGWTGTYIAEDQRKDFIGSLRCCYGTSAGLWVYHCVRWERASYFLPYPRRTSDAIKRHYADGARASMFYQGPVVNPAVEVNIAVGGRMLVHPSRSVADVLAEVVRRYYRPCTPKAVDGLVAMFLRGEEAYFGQWDPKEFASRKIPMPGELHLTDLIQSGVPGPAYYLMEPYLNAAGRKAYRKQLVELLPLVESLAAQCDDAGRLARIRTSLIYVLNLLDTVRVAKGEPWLDT